MKSTTSFSRDHDFPDTKDAEPDFVAIQNSPEFIQLRRRLLRFTVPLSVAFLTWYLTYVILAAYAHDFMSQRVWGNVTVGLVLGQSQFVTTVIIMLWYLSFARRRIDPQVAELKSKS
jgi:uncharacterized membrane protein (DUF485 family)